MKKGDRFIVERCATGYVISHDGVPANGQWAPCETVKDIHAFQHKEGVLCFLRKALAFDLESGLARESQ